MLLFLGFWFLRWEGLGRIGNSFGAPPQESSSRWVPRGSGSAYQGASLPFLPTSPHFQVSFPAQRNPGKGGSLLWVKSWRWEWRHGPEWLPPHTQADALIRSLIMPERHGQEVEAKSARLPYLACPPPAQLAPPLRGEPPGSLLTAAQSAQNTTVTTLPNKAQGHMLVPLLVSGPCGVRRAGKETR